MILVDWEIKDVLKDGELVIEPMEDDQVGPASIDLRLGNDVIFFNPKRWASDNQAVPIFIDRPKEKDEVSEDHARKGMHCINPKQFALFSTIEKITLSSQLIGQLEGRSSVGRQGLFIHNAGYIDPGFSGTITLELFNATDSPLILPVGMKICQLILHRCQTCDVPYNKRPSSKYLGQNGVTLSRLEKANIKEDNDD